MKASQTSPAVGMLAGLALVLFSLFVPAVEVRETIADALHPRNLLATAHFGTEGWCVVAFGLVGMVVLVWSTVAYLQRRRMP